MAGQVAFLSSFHSGCGMLPLFLMSEGLVHSFSKPYLTFDRAPHFVFSYFCCSPKLYPVLQALKSLYDMGVRVTHFFSFFAGVGGGGNRVLQIKFY